MYTCSTNLMYFIISVYSVAKGVLASLRVIDKGLFPLENKSVGIQFYIDIENVDGSNDCRIRTWVKKCCLAYPKHLDCRSMFVYGEEFHILNPKSREILIYIYPTVFQHDKKGFCDFVLDYQCAFKKYKKEITVNFDNTINKKKLYTIKSYLNGDTMLKCESLDENSLGNCDPVNCNLKYNDQKPFYDDRNKICVEAEMCITDANKDLPDLVYLPKINICRDLDHPLTIVDIYAIKTGETLVKETRRNKGFEVVMKSNCSTVSQNLRLLRDLMYGKLCPVSDDTAYIDFSQCCRSAFISIISCIALICALILLCVCCVHITVYLQRKWSSGEMHSNWHNIKVKFKKKKPNYEKKSYVNMEIKNKLLKDIIATNIPLELRDSINDICERLGRDATWNNRYRIIDLEKHQKLKLESDSSDSA